MKVDDLVAILRRSALPQFAYAATLPYVLVWDGKSATPAAVGKILPLPNVWVAKYCFRVGSPAVWVMNDAGQVFSTYMFNGKLQVSKVDAYFLVDPEEYNNYLQSH